MAEDAQGGLIVRRNEDGPEVWVERWIDAAPDAVWARVSDPSLSARYSRELREIVWLDGATAVVEGARFEGHNGRGDTTWTTTCTVTAHEPGRSWGFAVEDVENPVSVWTWEVSPEGDGCRVRHHARLGPGRSGLTWAIKNDPDNWESLTRSRLESLQRSMAGTLEGLADEVAAG